MLSVPKSTPLWMDSFPGLMSSSNTLTLCDEIFVKMVNTCQYLSILVQPWVVSPEHALAVLKAEGSTPSHVSNFDALRGVQVVSGVLRVLLD